MEALCDDGPKRCDHACSMPTILVEYIAIQGFWNCPVEGGLLMKKLIILAAALVLLGMGTAEASIMIIDFRSEAFAAANLQSGYSFDVNGIQGEMTAETSDGIGLLTYNVGSGGNDGIGIVNEYEYDEIEGGEVLAISFLTAVPITGFTVTDLFQEKGYLEQGWYQVTLEDGSISEQFDFFAQPGSDNGLLDVLLDATLTQAILEIRFGAPGKDISGENHEFSLAALSITDKSEAMIPTPIPGAVWLLGSGLLGVLGIYRRRKES